MVAYRFEDTQWGQTQIGAPKKTKTQKKPKVNHNDNHLGDIRFRQLFKNDDWYRLPAAVRRRFGRRVELGDTLIYRGHVEFNRVNRWGRILTNLLRIIGAPLPLDTDNEGAAAVVTVTEAPGKNGEHDGQVWMRQYARKDTKHPFPQIIQSTKRFEGPTGVEEYIGGGIGMSLKACVEGQELVFNAEDIFWDIKIPLGKNREGKIRLTLPRWLGPNLLRAGHEEIGNGTFAFTLRLEHKWFGKMLNQRVWFQDDLKPLDDAPPQEEEINIRKRLEVVT